MHHIASHAQAAFQVPPAYAPHSQGYSRVALVDHTIPGAVHTGLGLCQLDVQGALNPHVHFYEEAFFVLEGPVVARIDGHDVLLGPGDYGSIPPGVPMPCATEGRGRRVG
jgi:quercetin dioxygenase-like cupin family protein